MIRYRFLFVKKECVCKKFVGIFSIAQASGQMRKLAGSISPPMENRHTSQPNGGLTPPRSLVLHPLYFYTPAGTAPHSSTLAMRCH